METFVRLFITSRPIVRLEGKLGKLVHLDIAADKSDIKTYLEHEIDTNNRLSSFVQKDTSLKAQIKKNVNENTDGM